MSLFSSAPAPSSGTCMKSASPTTSLPSAQQDAHHSHPRPTPFDPPCALHNSCPARLPHPPQLHRHSSSAQRTRARRRRRILVPRMVVPGAATTEREVSVSIAAAGTPLLRLARGMRTAPPGTAPFSLTLTNAPAAAAAFPS
ncbi:hypothetical protein DFH06DRAFT_1130344 [Mycena polygramma]|nr:hypothetical protein DFH06DRAFT_1130344 [Mycena polygramma]